MSDGTALTQALAAGEIDGAYEISAAAVPALRPDGVHAAEDHVLAGGRVAAGPFDQPLQAVPAEVGGVPLAQPAVPPPDPAALLETRDRIGRRAKNRRAGS